MGSRYHANGQFWGVKGWPIVKCRTVCRELCKNSWSDRDAVWDAEWSWPKEACIGWGPNPPCISAIWEGKGRPIVKCKDLLPWAVKKRLNRSRCRLYSDGFKEVSVRWGAHWRHLTNTIGLSMCGGDTAFLSNYVYRLLSYAVHKQTNGDKNSTAGKSGRDENQTEWQYASKTRLKCYWIQWRILEFYKGIPPHSKTPVS